MGVFVTTKWLKEIVRTAPKNVRILDASWHLPNTGRDPEAEYKERHIPGAQFFNIETCASQSPYPHMICGPREFETFVGKLGINNNTHVVLYDNHPEFPLYSAQRAWWSFRLFGHENVSILIGGFNKWVKDGGETTAEVSSVPVERLEAKFDPSLVKYYEDVDANLEKKQFTLVDVRPEGRFKGISPEPRSDTKPGSIPGSVNLPFSTVLNLEDPEQAMKSPEELRAVFDAAGVDLSSPIVASCGTGISGCVLTLAAYVCGKKDVALYDGSWTEWYLRAPAHKTRDVPVS